MQARLHDVGVTALTGTPVTSVDAHDDGAEVALADGRVLTADLVVAGFGARLNSEVLGDLAGPEGVRCDDHGRVVGHPGLYAVGDVSAWYDPRSKQHVRREHWSSASDQSAIAAHAIVGLEAPRFLESPPYFWTDQPGVKVQLIGWPELADRDGWLEIDDVEPHSVVRLASGRRPRGRGRARAAPAVRPAPQGADRYRAPPGRLNPRRRVTRRSWQ